MVPVLNGITFEAIDAYAARFGIKNGESFWRFERMIRALDSVLRQDAAKKGKKTKSGSGGKPQGGGSRRGRGRR